MSYTNKEKQREYQRKWQAEKAKTDKLLPKAPVLSWREQLEKATDTISSYNKGVEEAKKLVSNRKRVNRMLVAEIAQRCLAIRHGGDYRSSEFRAGKYGLTLSKMAEEIGLNKRTLSEWVRIKTYVYDKLPDMRSVFDFTAASYAADEARAAKNMTLAAQLYSSYEEGTEKRISVTLRNTLHVAAFSKPEDYKALTKAQRMECLKFHAMIFEALNGRFN